ncbi:hypothetical protein FJQ54_06055 [Sandaracinobacter neustonicus]|uniref:Uncharacterized protein n=1 Tax=Sandaracinobacter neustonicus TaxID=1715348 RepID=A0A501XPL3_9SPHN|nr:hypothetical protein [Sandaracinobacter neustonicus]TPE62460.1 hypothetical protein FJQ54_06055 [Sandaracinobacter neustonicus]
MRNMLTTAKVAAEKTKSLGAQIKGNKNEAGRMKMSMVAKYSVAFAASVMLTAISMAALSGLSFETLVSPHFWVISVSLAGIFSLAIGNGIGTAPNRRAPSLPATGLLPA